MDCGSGYVRVVLGYGGGGGLWRFMLVVAYGLYGNLTFTGSRY